MFLELPSTHSKPPSQILDHSLYHVSTLTTLTIAFVPRRTEAILFYSQFPDGTPDRLSLHAGCPVLEGI